MQVCDERQMRNIMSFETSNNFLDQFEQKRPVMVAWEHIPGATVHTGLFNEYQLPNGRKTFFYYSTSMLEETPVRFCLRRPVPKPKSFHSQLLSPPTPHASS